MSPKIHGSGVPEAVDRGLVVLEDEASETADLCLVVSTLPGGSDLSAGDSGGLVVGELHGAVGEGLVVSNSGAAVTTPSSDISARVNGVALLPLTKYQQVFLLTLQQ